MSSSNRAENRRLSLCINLLGAAILLGAYAMAVSHMFRIRKEQLSTDSIVLRLTHWQLESGVRDGLELMARKFEQRYFDDTGTRIRIIQNPISERVYRQYVQTQCIGRTAPDIIEIGFYDSEYTSRYFLSNSEDVKKPNPYNKGTVSENVAWADTYYDGMQGSLDQRNLEYYGAGLSTFSIRLFYNKRLFKEALGTDTPPQEYREFIAVCEKLRGWAKAKGNADFVPIAGAKYQLGIFRDRFTNSMLLDFTLDHDKTFNGTFNDFWDVLMAYAAEEYSLQDPAIRGGFDLLARMTEYFPPGFMSQDRMESGFRFTQGKAAFITSGSWDAMSFFLQSDFPIGVLDFPLPTPADPEYGKLVRGRQSESGSGAGFRFGVTKFSKHPDIALKFLQFMTTAENNEELNRVMKWLPVITGTKTHPVMVPFAPKPEGFWGATPLFNYWGFARASMVMEQEQWNFVEHKTTYDQFVGAIQNRVLPELAVDMVGNVKKDRDLIQALKSPIGGNLGAHLFADTWGAPAAEARILRERSDTKVKYLWESHMPLLIDNIWLWKWQELVASGAPRAKKIQSCITEDLGILKE